MHLFQAMYAFVEHFHQGIVVFGIPIRGLPEMVVHRPSAIQPLVFPNDNIVAVGHAKQRPQYLVVTADERFAEAYMFGKIWFFLRLKLAAHEAFDGELGTFGGHGDTLQWLELEQACVLLNGG